MIELVLSTVLAVVIAERLSDRITPKLFKSQMEELMQEEMKLVEMNEIAMIAIAVGDKEAYLGLQSEMSDLYGRIFFGKIAMFSSVFFGLLSAYILLVIHIFHRSVVTVVLAVVMLYYTIKAIYYYFFVLLR